MPWCRSPGSITPASTSRMTRTLSHLKRLLLLFAWKWYICQWQSGCLRSLSGCIPPFSTHTVFSYFTHCHSFHASSFTLFHFTRLSPSNSCCFLSRLSRVPPPYFFLPLGSTFVAESLQQDSAMWGGSFVFRKHPVFMGGRFCPYSTQINVGTHEPDPGCILKSSERKKNIET